MRALVKHTQSLHTAVNALHTFTKTTETLLIFCLIKFQFGCKCVLLAYYYRATTIILPLNVKRMVMLIFFQSTSSSSSSSSLLSFWCWWHVCSHFHRFPEHFFLRDAIFIHKLDFTHRHQSTLNWLHATFERTLDCMISMELNSLTMKNLHEIYDK